MIDTHLLNMALAAMGIGFGAAVLIAVTIIVAAFVVTRRRASHHSGLSARTHESLADEPAPGKPGPREPVLQ